MSQSTTIADASFIYWESEYGKCLTVILRKSLDGWKYVRTCGRKHARMQRLPIRNALQQSFENLVCLNTSSSCLKVTSHNLSACVSVSQKVKITNISTGGKRLSTGCLTQVKEGQDKI